MAKGQGKNERIKLDMSFEDALRFAAKTKPPMTINLELNKETIIPHVSGKIIQFEAIEIYGNEANKFALYTNRAHGGKSRLKTFAITNVTFQKISDTIFQFKDPFLDVTISEALFVRISPLAEKQDQEFKSCKLTYWITE